MRLYSVLAEMARRVVELEQSIAPSIEPILENIEQLWSNVNQLWAEISSAEQRAKTYADGKLQWTQIASGGSTGGTRVTVTSLTNYKEIMIRCGTSSTGAKRAIATTIIPVFVLRESTDDTTNGLHQAVHPSSTNYVAGVSYVNDVTLKLYHSSNASCTIYAR